MRPLTYILAAVLMGICFICLDAFAKETKEPVVIVQDCGSLSGGKGRIIIRVGNEYYFYDMVCGKEA